MIRIRHLLTIVLATVALVALAACGNGGGGGGGKSGPVEVVTHNAVGGGSDVFTRQMIKVMYENKIIDTNWPVRNVPAGDSIGAMSYMVERSGEDIGFTEPAVQLERLLGKFIHRTDVGAPNGETTPQKAE